MGAHIALRPGPPMGFLGWVLPQRTRPMGAHSAVYLELVVLRSVVAKERGSNNT
jgi:hypothetical protein